jgi:glutamyl-tRNA(Gln) amidotransferase subunit D
MKTKTFSPGEIVKIQTRDKSWQGTILESHDPEIILLKLTTGYNIGIRENEIINAKVIEKSKKDVKDAEIHISKKEKLPNVVIIITGGTISSRLDSKTGAVIPTARPEDIISIAPEITSICNLVAVEIPFMKLSGNMDSSDWKKIAETCLPYLNNSKIDGIIITHGTDTLHYTSAALSFFIKNLNKPIALTYSQKSIDRGSTDANLNLICSAKYATSDIAEIAIVGHKDTNDKLCLAMGGTKVRKMHTSRRDAFQPINSEPIAEISRDKLKIIKNFNAKDLRKKAKLDIKYFEKITLIKIHPGQDPEILEHYANKGYKGIILEVTGLGHVPSKESKQNWLPKIKKAIQNGITIAAAPQTIYGRLNPNVYAYGRDLQKTGIIFLEDLLPETALVKLGYVLGHKSWNPKEKLIENIAGEFNDKIES